MSPGHVRRRCCAVVALAAAALAGCAKEPVLGGSGATAPNPNGCYVFVYEQPNRRGERVILNGPGKWPSLERLRRDDKDWRKRIRSIEVGSGANVTLYTEPDFRGTSQLFGPGSDEARLNASMSVGIESLALSCRSDNP